MPATFTRAPRVAADDLPNSAAYRGLARAFNDRLRLVGDLAWRISWYWFTLWRQVRNSDSSGFAFPPQGEWFDIYAHIDPDYASIEWPPAGPGTPEGANLANPAMQAVYGVEGGPDDEPTRSQLPMAKPTTLAGYWALGKDQRGAYDPATGAMNAPAFDAGLSLLNFAHDGLVPMHKSYGGWLPQPAKLLEDCGTTEATGLHTPSYEIFFTALRDGVATAALNGSAGLNGEGRITMTYAGTCPCGSDEDNTGHVLGVVRHPLYYIVYVSQGTAECAVDVDYLPTRDWIEGPYEAEPYLAHTEGGQIQRGAHQFFTDFHGSDEQRAGDEYRIEAVGFPSQEFFTRQYALAPARGQIAGSLLQEVYPSAMVISTGTILANSLASWAPGQTEHATAEGFVVAGWYVSASGLAGPAALEVLDGDIRIGAVTLQPDGDGAAEDLRWMVQAVPASRLRFRVAADVPLRNAGVGSIVIEIAELLAWKPFFWDAYVVTRNGGSLGGDQMAAGVDGRGVDCEKAPQITRDLFRYGCLVNDDATALRPQADWVNDNPFYDAMRRATRNQVRITPRRQLVGYEVGADGKSVLYFKRFAYGLSSSRVDLFDGIAPPVSPVWSLEEGEHYVVHGAGFVSYRGSSYASGSVFTAMSETAFEVSGDARVYVHDGIRHAAHKRGTTNEWVMFLETKCYHPSESSIWKASAYSDYFTWNQRCLFYPYVMPGVVRQHVAVQYGVAMDGDTFSLQRLPMRVQTSILAPEAPPGYRFAAGTNSTSVTPSEEFCRACRLYESPYEIESCTVDDWADDQVVKVVLTNRLRSHEDAPATVDRSAGSWSGGTVADLAAETYRTDDNAVREYMRHQADPAYHCSWKEGDAGAGSLLPFLPDNPFGSCYPTFHFVHLVPEPYEDGNATMDSHDTRVVADAYQQMECYLRVICEAFVDGRTSADLVCQLGGGDIYDYTFENLCFDAFGGRWIGAFDPAEPDRGDDPPGFGPLPNTLIYAETHNRLAAAVDLLTKIRVDLPTVISVRRHDGEASRTVFESESCSDTGAFALWIDAQQPPTVNSVTPVAWDVVSLPTLLTADQVAGIEGCPFALVTTRTDQEWKVEIDSVYQDALPDWLAGLFDVGRARMLTRTDHTVTRYSRQATDLAGSDGCCNADDLPCPGHWSGGGGVYYRWVESTQTETICGDGAQGTITASLPPVSDFNIGRDSDMPAGVWCGIGSVDRREVTLFDTTPYVEFDLVDPA